MEIKMRPIGLSFTWISGSLNGNAIRLLHEHGYQTRYSLQQLQVRLHSSYNKWNWYSLGYYVDDEENVTILFNPKGVD